MLNKSVDKYAKMMSVTRQKEAALKSVVNHVKGVTNVGKKIAKDKKLGYSACEFSRMSTLLRYTDCNLLRMRHLSRMRQGLGICRLWAQNL